MNVQKRGCLVRKSCLIDFVHLAQTGVQILVSLGEHLSTHLKYYTGYDQDPEIHGKPRKLSLPVGKAQVTGYLKVGVSSPMEWDAAI